MSLDPHLNKEANTWKAIPVCGHAILTWRGILHWFSVHHVTM